MEQHRDQQEKDVDNVKVALSDAANILSNSKVVSIRFDLVPWAMVLDIDVPGDESPSTAHHRAWAVFSGVSELSLPFESIRYGPGFWTSGFEIVLAADYNTYSVRFLLMQGSQKRIEGSTYLDTAKIRAQNLVCLKSIGAAATDEFRNLTFIERNALATDHDFLSLYKASKDSI